MAVIIDGDLGVDKIKDGSVTSDDLASTLDLSSKAVTLPSSIPLGVRNLIINGDMRIDQRNAGASVTTTNTFPYTVDRWQVGGTNNSKFTAQQNSGSVTPPVGFTNYMGMVSSSAYTPSGSEEYDFRQPIEANNMQHLAWGTSDAKTITLSFWVRSSLTGTFGGALFNYAGNYSYPFTYTISSANTWEQKSITIEGPTAGSWNTGNTGFVWINFSLGAGATVKGTAGSWSANYYAGATGQTEIVGTSGATLYITGVQLEVGDTATPFEHRPYDMELARCLRYFEKSGASATPILSANESGFLITNMYNNVVNNSYYANVFFKVIKRANPTVVTYPYTTPTNTGRWSNDVGTDYGTSSATTPAGPKQWGFNVANQSGTTLTIGSQKIIIGNWYADAEL